PQVTGHFGAVRISDQAADLLRPLSDAAVHLAGAKYGVRPPALAGAAVDYGASITDACRAAGAVMTESPSPLSFPDMQSAASSSRCSAARRRCGRLRRVRMRSECGASASYRGSPKAIRKYKPRTVAFRQALERKVTNFACAARCLAPAPSLGVLGRS